MKVMFLRAPTTEQPGHKRLSLRLLRSPERHVSDRRPENGHRSQKSQRRLCRNAAEWSVCYDERRSHLAKRKRVPVSQTDSNGDYPGITGIVFDPAVGGVTGGKTNTIFAASYGNGVYESTNGGARGRSIGGPTDVAIRRRLEHWRLLCRNGIDSRIVRCGAMRTAHGLNSNAMQRRDLLRLRSIRSIRTRLYVKTWLAS